MLEQEKVTNEELLWPPKTDIINVGLYAAWSIIAWFLWSIIIVVSIYFFLQKAQSFQWVYPYIYSMTWFFATLFSAGINIFMNKIVNPNKYKRWIITFAQVFLYSIILYIFIVPVYVYAVYQSPVSLVYVFTVHVVLAVLWSSILTEILSNYRYILLWIYWTFMGAFVSILLSFIVFFTFTESSKNLFILIWLLMLINWAIHTIRALFEFIYYIYYNKTWMDQLWDIFYQIESEEKEIVEKARKSLERYE